VTTAINPSQGGSTSSASAIIATRNIGRSDPTSWRPKTETFGWAALLNGL
jgi:hypothetical protein